jgi:hypothetical protein
MNQEAVGCVHRIDKGEAGALCKYRLCLVSLAGSLSLCCYCVISLSVCRICLYSMQIKSIANSSSTLRAAINCIAK